VKLFPIIDQALLAQESRDAYYSKTPRVWPSEASAELFDKREADIIGGCHRKSYFRLTGEAQSNTIDAVGARRFRTGRAMELDIIALAKDAGIFVASGVRYHVADIDLPLELDLVVFDPATKRLYIVENKTIYGYTSNKKVIKEGNPKLEGVMQSCIYLNEFATGEVLKSVIAESWQAKEDAAALMTSLRSCANFDPTGWEFQKASKDFERNRIEVDWDALDATLDGPIGVKMAYETRDDCQTREFDIGLSQDPLDGQHYPEIDGIPQRLFTLESVYERFRRLQSFYSRNVEHVQRELAKEGLTEPKTGYEGKKYWDRVFEIVRNLPAQFWPPAEYQWQYRPEKIQTLGEAGLIGKTRYRDWQKRVKGKTHIGAWQCAYCPYKAKCISVEYPEMRHLVADLMSLEGEEAA
jgi:hypothetical protein